MKNEKILPTISCPDDLKKLPETQLPLLAAELRRRIINVVSENGGHLASNLGVIELTIALHRVFNSPADKIVWDVGHQCYAHKLLTGRQKQFTTLRKLGGISGFPKTAESPHDITETGHSSTSISSALGILLGQKIQGKDDKVVAVIGDGALTGGMALEALNHAGNAGKKLIIILNDNKMSISPNVGALSSHLSRLTATHTYQSFQRHFDSAIKRIPLAGKKIYNLLFRLKKGIKAILFRQNLFSDLGYEYIGPINGHNTTVLIDVLTKVKDIDKPVVVHVITCKGKGYRHAEGNPSLYHGVGAFSVIDGKIEKKSSQSYTDIFSSTLLKAAGADKKIVGITAAMAEGTGLALLREHFPQRFFDVGITEQHAVTFAAGLAISGLKPVVAIYSTFMQRAVDQVIHDVTLPSLPVIFCMDRAGLVGNDGETHQGVYDIPIFRSVPGLTLLAPATGAELSLMLSYGLRHSGPVMLRYPKALCPEEPEQCKAPLQEGRGVLIENEGDVLILTTGGLIREVMLAADKLLKKDIKTDIYNFRFLKPLDEKYLLSVIKKYRYLLCLEDGALTGGIGETLKSLLFSHHLSIPLETRGVPDEFVAQGTRNELLSLCGIDSAGIQNAVQEMIKQKTNITRFKLG